MHVLYIDDDALNRATLREMLRFAGVSLSEAADARTGLTMIEDGDFAVVLMDLRMPEMSGLTAIRKLRARRDAKGKVPILVVTADPTDGVRAMCQAAGAAEFLAKPVVLGQLLRSIGAAVAAGDTVVIH